MDDDEDETNGKKKGTTKGKKSKHPKGIKNIRDISGKEVDNINLDEINDVDSTSNLIQYLKHQLKLHILTNEKLMQNVETMCQKEANYVRETTEKIQKAEERIRAEMESYQMRCEELETRYLASQ